MLYSCLAAVENGNSKKFFKNLDPALSATPHPLEIHKIRPERAF